MVYGERGCSDKQQYFWDKVAHEQCDVTCDFDPALHCYRAQTVFLVWLNMADIKRERPSMRE